MARRLSRPFRVAACSALLGSLALAAPQRPSWASGSGGELPSGRAMAGPAWLGLSMMPPKGEVGVVAQHIVRGSPADKAGLVANDRIVRLDGHDVSAPRDVSAWVSSRGIGATLHIEFVRDGTLRKASTQLVRRPDPEDLFRMELIGRPLPDLSSLARVSGTSPTSWPALGGRVVLVDLFATWCGPCQQLGPHYREMHEKYAARGLTILAVSSEEPAVLSAWSKRESVGYTVASDPDERLFADLQVPALPSAIVVDRLGIVRDVSVGYHPSNVARMRATVESLLGESAKPKPGVKM